MATVSEESDTHLNAGSCIFSDCLQVSHIVRKCKLPVRGDEPISGDTYRWVERHSDGALVTQVVKKGSANKSSSGVIVKDDLPAADTEARVERITEYKVKGADIAAGKKLCAYKSDLENLFNGLPECGDGMTPARFVKTQVIIHVPAGSADKMLPVVPD